MKNIIKTCLCRLKFRNKRYIEFDEIEKRNKVIEYMHKKGIKIIW